MVVFTPSIRTSALPPNFFGALDRRIALARSLGTIEIIDVSKGNPDLPTPAHIVSEMQAQVALPSNHRYPSFTSRTRVREAIAQRYREDHGVDVDPEAHVATFHGSHEALMASVLALTNPGESVILPDPGYPMYESAAHFAGAVMRTLPLIRQLGYQPDFSTLDDLHRAAVLFLNYPNNPTGALARPETLAAAVEHAVRLGAAFVHDYAYSSLGFDGHKPISALTCDPDFDVTVELSTVSKTYNMAGWRFGYAVGNASAIEAMRRYQSHAFSTIFGATQEAAAAALAGDQSASRELVTTYERRRNLVASAIRGIGWDVVEPQGSFFVWIAVPGGGDDVRFANRLLDEVGVAVAPGSGFGSRGRGFVRISLVHDESTLSELVQRLSRVVTPATIGTSS